MRFRVVVVEDQVSSRQALLELFRSTGDAFEVVGTTATEAESKLWMSENPEGWDILITDLVLAQGSGIEVVRRAKQQLLEVGAHIFGIVLNNVKLEGADYYYSSGYYSGYYSDEDGGATEGAEAAGNGAS